MRKQSRAKRGSDAVQVTLAGVVSPEASADEIVPADAVLTRLGEVDEHMARIVEPGEAGG